MVHGQAPIVRPETQNRMVTKGYQKGVYDRVTEGTWEKGPRREPRAW